MKKLLKASIAFTLLLLLQQRTQAQTPIFNSDPASAAVLLLDFDGHIVQGTSWNVNGPIICGPSNLSNEQITEVYNRIAEDYRPFNINVTTDSTKYAAAPATKRTRVVFTISSSWYGNGAGGVAYIGSFTWGDNTPCFIFSALLNYNTKYISEAGAHEAGHTLGLRHQSSYDQSCNKTNEYNYGYGSGTASWAPIMGVGYYRNSTTWHNGPNPYGCTNTQQDLDVITSNNGLTFKADDYDETFRRASTVGFVNNSFKISGSIAQPADKDMIQFTTTGRKRLMLDVAPSNAGTTDAGANLDIQVQLYNSQRALIATIDPTTTLSATADTVLDAGTYYALIDGVGDEFTTDYGSLGAYSVQAQLADVTPLPLRKLELKGDANSGNHKLVWTIDADEQVTKQVLEASVNGGAYTAIVQPGAADRKYSSQNATPALVLYRLQVQFDNGRLYYSNTIALRSGKLQQPQLQATTINNSLQINSPDAFDYAVTDYNGRLLLKGRVQRGSSTVSAQSLNKGAFLIRYSNGSEQYVDKFVKQ